MEILIKNIKSLLQVYENPPVMVSGKEQSKIPEIKNGWLFIKDGLIHSFGSMDTFHQNELPITPHFHEIDADERLVFPAFCDSHTHLVYASSREQEFVDRINGLTYQQIAKRGGGINNSAIAIHNMSFDELYLKSLTRIQQIIALGTGAVEIKSGYGLNTVDELKMLRVIRKLKETTPITIKSTFLGAHAIPLKYVNQREKYIQLIIEEMIPAVANDNLADYIDVFCDRGFFTVAETEKILIAGIKYGLVPKIHANELDYSGGIQIGVKYKALSVDHLEFTGDAEIEALLASKTMPTLLPGAAFFLGLPEPPARKMINAGLPIALASDYNPGSAPSGNMSFIMALGCIRLHMLPEEVLNAVTINSSYAMGVSSQLGTITKGKKANVIITKPIPSLHYIPYSFGTNFIEQTILNGEI